MRTEFNNLVDLMNKYSLYHSTDEVGIALSELEQKITEFEKRIECARRSNQDSNSIIISLVDSFQDLGKTEEELTYGDFETLQRGVYDVDIALNFNDKEPIENNWYGLFDEPKKENVSRETLEVSNGGIPYRVCCHCAIKEEQNVMTKVSGDWLCYDCYDEIEDDKEKKLIVTNVINMLKDINVDGETMQHIIEQVGMTDQMLRQLIMSNPESDTNDILEEKRILNEARLDASKIN